MMDSMEIFKDDATTKLIMSIIRTNFKLLKFTQISNNFTIFIFNISSYKHPYTYTYMYRRIYDP